MNTVTGICLPQLYDFLLSTALLIFPQTERIVIPERKRDLPH